MVELNRCHNRQRGICHPTCKRFHVDDYSNASYKVFVLLTRISALGDGPYCYVPGSHKWSRALLDANRALVARLPPSFADHNDVFLVAGKPVVCMGEPGDVVISNQSGAHRGFPQSESGLRALAVYHYTRVA